jgi:hypothetical protein
MTSEPTAGGRAPDPEVSVVRPGEGETIILGTTQFRVLEDGRNTGHRLGFAESVLAPHTFANPGDEPAVMLSTFTPDLYVQYFRDLRDMIASGQRLSPQASIGVMGNYATEPATEFL